MLTNAIRIICSLRNPSSAPGKLQSINSGFSSLMIRIGLAAFLVFAAGTFNVKAQQMEVSGTVTDATDDTPLPGVNIVIKGTSTGTTTDDEGEYSLNVGSPNDTLVVSFVGYLTQQVPVNGRSVINVSMNPDVAQLEDVVVVGYGTQEERQITGSVSSVSSEEFNRGNISEPTQLLQGKVPGLSIYQKGGDPNGEPTIRLRGISTVGANTEPLVVVDGVSGASLDNVDPNDIESIDVLKDGSAAAIYGTRASSGVILVTTKKGTAGEGPGVQIDYNGQVSSDFVANNQPVMTASEYTSAGGNDLGSVTDWQDLVTRNAFSHVHNMAVAGGSSSTQYRVSTNYRDTEGILEKSGFDQINARASVSHTALDDRLDVTLNASATKRESNFSFNEALRYATLYNPTAPVRFDNGEYFQAILFDNFNPVAIIEQNVNDGQSKNLNYNIQAEFDALDQLSLSANFSQQFNSRSSGEFYPNNSFFRGLNRDGLARRFFEENEFTLFETFANYMDSFENIDINVIAGYSFQEDYVENLTLELGNLPSNELGYHGIDLSGDRVLGNASNVFIDSYASPDERIIAFFGRVNLTYNDNIFLNASLRREGSTKLGPENQWGNFPAASIGADVSNYLPWDIVNQLKVRVGYGVTGALPRQSGLAQDLWNYSFDGGGTVSKARDANPDLKWEEKAEINLGVDYALLDDRLTGSFDVYQRNINDFILEVAVPTDQFISGTQFQNAGELQTRGLEFTANYDAIRDSDVHWNTGIVFSTYKTTLEEFIIEEQMRANLGSPGQNSTNMIRVAEGEEIGQIWGPVFSGEVDTDGSPIMEDLNGDGELVVSQGDALADNGDFKRLGNGIPDFEIGWTNQVNYKNWGLNAFFRGAFGHSLVNTFRAFYEPIDPGAINSYNRVITEKAVEGLTVSQFSSLYVEKADFIKLDNLTLSYNFDMSGNNMFRNMRAYLNAENVFTITNYTGIDPEPVLQDFGPVGNGGRASFTPDVLSPGIDRRNNYFTARTISLGINVGF